MQPAKERVGAVIVTYHPPAGLAALVAAIVPQVARVLVIDNAPHEVALPRDIERVSNASNVGVATALNQGCRWAAAQGFEWVLFLDQDTVVLPDLVAGLAACWRPGVALLGAGREGVHAGDGAVAVPVPFVITSGSLLSLEAYRAAGPFLDALFIDWVDHEYGWRLQARGWTVLQSLRPGMRHDWGSPTYTRFLGLKLRLENYPAWRRYYIVRNWVYVCTRYFGQRPWEASVRLLKLVRQVMKVLLFEGQRREKAQASWRGLRDGLLGRLGARSD